MSRVVNFMIDAQRTTLQQRFFSHFAFATTDELISAVAEMEVGLGSISRSEDATAYVYSGWVYWFLFLKGYLQYRESQDISDENIYFCYLTEYYGPRGHDPGMSAQLTDVPQARTKIQARFDVFDTLKADRTEATLEQIVPVVVTVSGQMPEHPLRVYPVDAPDSLGGRLVDGWHRLFAARVSGAPSLRGRAVFEDEMLEKAN